MLSAIAIHRQEKACFSPVMSPAKGRKSKISVSRRNIKRNNTVDGENQEGGDVW